MKRESKWNVPEIYEAFGHVRLPRWTELPDLELYMDQVLGLIDRYLGSYPGFDRKGLTASMVNNYVKLGIMPAPVKKKYTRAHLAYLIIICILKASIPIAGIQKMIEGQLTRWEIGQVYDHFCVLFDHTGQAVADSLEQLPPSSLDEADPDAPIWYAALRAQAEQALALKLLSAYPMDPKI